MIWCNINNLRFYLTRIENIDAIKNDVWFVKQINTILNCSRVKLMTRVLNIDAMILIRWDLILLAYFDESIKSFEACSKIYFDNIEA